MIRATQQLDPVRDRLRAGAEDLSRGGSRTLALSTKRLEVLDVRSHALGEIDDAALGGDGDRVAAVARGLRGAMFGTALFAMEPEDAFGWVLSSGVGSDPLESYVAGASEILETLIVATARTVGPAELGEPALHEESLMEILVGTHAPSDTLVVSARLVVHTDSMKLPASFYLLVSQKHLAQLSAGLLG